MFNVFDRIILSGNAFHSEDNSVVKEAVYVGAIRVKVNSGTSFLSVVIWSK